MMLSAAILLPALSLLGSAQAASTSRTSNSKRANPDLGLQTFYSALGGYYATYVGCTGDYYVSGSYSSPKSWGLYPALQASCDQQTALCNKAYTSSQCSTQANNCRNNQYLAVNAYESGGSVCPDYASGSNPNAAISATSVASTASVASVASVSSKSAASVSSVSVTSVSAASVSSASAASVSQKSVQATASAYSVSSANSAASVQSTQSVASVASAASVSSSNAAVASNSQASVASVSSVSSVSIASVASVSAAVSNSKVASNSALSVQATQSAASVLSVSQASASAAASNSQASALSVQATASAASVSQANAAAASNSLASVASTSQAAAASNSLAAVASNSQAAAASISNAAVASNSQVAAASASNAAVASNSQAAAASISKLGAAASQSVASVASTSLAAQATASAKSVSVASIASVSSVSVASVSSVAAAAASQAAALVLPSGYKIGSSSLIAEASSGRALSGYSFDSDSMTPSLCATTCTSQGYALSGTEYSTQCYCGNSLDNGASLTATSTSAGMACGGDSKQACGGFSAISLVYNTALASLSNGAFTLISVPVTLPTGYKVATSSLISEGSSGRALTGASTSSSSMTPSVCATFCTAANYALSATEYGSECYCGNALSNGITLSSTSSAAAMKCAGDATQTCGGFSALSVVYNTALASVSNGVVTITKAATVTLPTGYKSLSTSLIAEGPSGRALSGTSTTDPAMTPTMCATFCTKAGYALSGTEYATECYCGNSLTNGASLTLLSTNTGLACGGDSTQICGAGSALSVVYNTALATVTNGVITVAAAAVVLPTGYKAASTSTIAEGSSGRALTGASTEAANMTPTVCANYCTAAGFPISGTEYATQCYCGNTLSNGASLSLTSTSTMACAGDATQTCGGFSALSVVYNSAAATLTNGVLASIAAAVTLPSGYKVASTSTIAEGSAGRALTGASTEAANMTPTVCAKYCTAAGFAISGTEYSTQCYCGNTLSNGASLSATSTSTMACAGDSTQTCGGFSALSVVYNTALATLTNGVLTSTAAAAAATVTTLSNGFTSTLQCWSEVDGRLLKGAGFTSSAMTYNLCSDYCFNAGFTQAGVEWGQECYCSSSVDLTKLVSNSNCNVPCAGDSSKICGGAQALQIFTTTKAATTILSLANGWTSNQTCYAEVDGRLLASASLDDPNMTPTMCTNFCSSGGYTQAGVEYATQCYCSSTVNLGKAATSANCNLACGGDPTVVCGGNNALNVYTTTSTTKKTRRHLPKVARQLAFSS